MSDYSKYKDSRPEDTILKIQRILNDIGLFPVQTWTEHSLKGAASCRVTLYPTDYGTNGKGTDELYATASAYGELIERLQNNILTYRDRGDDLYGEVGFKEFPDEIDRHIMDIVNDPDPYSEVMLPRMGFHDDFSQMNFLREISNLYGGSEKTIPVVPFADPVENKIEYLPIAFITEMTMSNGMAAGNTLEEAMVQAMSEIFERAVQTALLTGKAIPPEIPEEEIKKYSLYHLIRQIHVEGRYRVKLFDCSMGKGWPVAGMFISDLETGNFGLKLGAHPSFAVAVERTLTESFQGRDLESFSNASQAGTIEQSANFHNLMNVAKTANGIYPRNIFTDQPGWEYRPWTKWEKIAKQGENKNREFLRELFSLLKAEGGHPLVRDCSFLGFPAVHIVVPGFSEVYAPGKMKYKAIATTRKVRRSFDHFPDLTGDEETRLLRLIEFNEYSIRDNQIGFFMARQLSEKYCLDRIAAYLALKHGKYEKAQHFFTKLAGNAGKPEDALYYQAMVRYTQCRKEGYLSEDSLAYIRVTSRDEVSSRVENDVKDLSGIMGKQFEQIHCFDCENCPVFGKECTYPDTREIVVKVMRAMKCENVSQERMLELTGSLYHASTSCDRKP